MSLRARLVWALMGMVALGVGVAAGAMFGAIQDWAGDAADAEAADALLGRATGVAVGTAVAALLGIALLAPAIVGRALRPLDDLVATAATIGGGEPEPPGRAGREGTEVARLTRALTATGARIDAALRERDAAAERLRRFVADASHELRTPVAAIRGYAELFRRGAAERPADLAKAMARIEAEAARMGRLVDDLLVLAGLDDDPRADRRPVDLAEVCADAVAAARLVHPDRAWELAAAPVPVLGDPDRLRQVVDNLLANVARHTPPGAPAAVTAGRDGDDALLTVADRGPGLPPEELERVFERFHGSGSGLGLAIVAAVAAAHGGTASAANRAGGGAVFSVRFPTEPAIHGRAIQTSGE